jgi:hypothetical protein
VSAIPERLQFVALLLLASILTMRHAGADLAPLTSIELHKLCLAYIRAPDSDDAHACAAYVRGFIEGSDKVLLRADETKVSRRESFSDRAWRTRLGIGAPPRPEYCLDDTATLQKIVRQLVLHAETAPSKEDVSASALLYGTLSRFHRCRR